MAKKKDYLDGDHSFKKWFSIMWKNGYIFLFSLFLLISVVFSLFPEAVMMEGTEYTGSRWGIFGFGLLGMGIIAYKGFWQFWNDLKNGRSR
jgi:hypothetical protein